MSMPTAAIGALVGLFASMALNKGSGQTANTSSSAIPLQAAPTMPMAPEQASAVEDNPALVASEDAADQAKKAAALRAERNKDVYTSPLGAVGGITQQKKTLLGA